MNILEGFWLDTLAFAFEVGNLPADHTFHGASSAAHFLENRESALSRRRTFADDLKRQGEQSIAGEDCGGFAKLFVARGLSAAEVIVIQSRQIVANQRIGVNEFDGASRIHSRAGVRVKNARRLKAQNGLNAFVACE